MDKNITLVSGGSSGLGLEIARCHLKNGGNVCIVGRSKERLDGAVKELTKPESSGKLLAFPCNVANEEQVTEVFSKLEERGFTVRNVYNVAGIGLYCEPTHVTREMIDKLLEGNFTGLLVFSTYALRAMQDGGGTIINVISSAAKKANPMETVYCGVKWGARGYTEALASALKGSAIRVLAVYPGGMNTPFWAGDTGLSADTSKFMDPTEVAETIVAAVSDRKSLKVTELTIDRK